MKVITGNASKELGQFIANKLGIQLSCVRVSRFADGEINVEVPTDLYNREVFIIQATDHPVNDNFMELCLIVDAVKRIGAKKIIAIIPYYGYSRQDRIIDNNNFRSALSARVVANFIEAAGVHEIAVIDLHSSQIEGFFNIPITNLNCFEVFVDHIEKKDLAIVAPDVGALGRARAFAKVLNTNYNIVVIDKYRERAGISQVMNIIGEVANKNCVIVDDIVDSGGTLCNAAHALKDAGAKSVMACITHGVLSGSAVEKISVLDKLIITNTILPKFTQTHKIEVVSITNVLIDYILKIQEDKDVN
mgnify:CR=1 FL=1